MCVVLQGDLDSIHQVPYLVCGHMSFRAAVEKLHCVDDAFRRQLESIQAAHQAELLQLANEKQKQMERTNQKVQQRGSLI